MYRVCVAPTTPQHLADFMNRTRVCASDMSSSSYRIVCALCACDLQTNTHTRAHTHMQTPVCMRVPRISAMDLVGNNCALPWPVCLHLHNSRILCSLFVPDNIMCTRRHTHTLTNSSISSEGHVCVCACVCRRCEISHIPSRTGTRVADKPQPGARGKQLSSKPQSQSDLFCLFHCLPLYLSLCLSLAE